MFDDPKGAAEICEHYRIVDENLGNLQKNLKASVEIEKRSKTDLTVQTDGAQKSSKYRFDLRV